MSGRITRLGYQDRCPSCMRRPPSQDYPEGTTWQCNHCRRRWIVMDRRSGMTVWPYVSGALTWYRKKWYHR